MQRRVKNVAILLIILLSSCKKLDFKRCQIDLIDNVADCFDYEITEKNIGKVGPLETIPLNGLHGGFCVTPSDWAKIYATIKSEID